MRVFKPLLALLLAVGLAGCTSYGSYGYQEGYAYPSYDYGYQGYGYPSYGYYPGYAYGPDVGLGFSYYNYNYGPSYRGGYGYGHQGNWNNGHWNGAANGGQIAPPPGAQRQPSLGSGFANNGPYSTRGGAEIQGTGRPTQECPSCWTRRQ